MNKLAALLSILICSLAHADLSNLDSYTFDANGNAINSTSNALNAFLTNSSLAVTQSGTWTTGRTWSLLNTTDSVNAVQSGTWTVQQGSAPWADNITQLAGNAISTNSGATGAGTLRVSGNLSDGAGNKITSDNPGTANNQRLHVATPDTTTASTTLGALNAFVSIAMAGLSSAGFQINSGTFIGTLLPQCSLDGGTTWANAGFYNPTTNNVVSSYVFASANTTQVLPMVALSGSSNCRVTVSAYTSGSANAIMRASQVTGASGTIPAATSLSNFFYDDMDVATGGIARATNFVVGTLTQLYTHSGSGTVYGFTLNLGGLGGAQTYLIDLVLDSNHIFGATGISTGDLLNNAIYDISQVTTDALGFAGWAFPDKAIRWTVPGGGFVSYSNSVTINVKQTAGGAAKFNAGLIALTR